MSCTTPATPMLKNELRPMAKGAQLIADDSFELRGRLSRAMELFRSKDYARPELQKGLGFRCLTPAPAARILVSGDVLGLVQ